jgi:hypothetical protein
MEQSHIFDKIYRQYCDQIAKVDFESIRNILGIGYGDNGSLCIPFFNKRHLVSRNGIKDVQGNRANSVVSTILSQYVLLCPDEMHLNPEWVSFKDFKRASYSTVAIGFSSESERVIKKHFSGRLDALSKACASFGGSQCKMNVSYDLVVQFNALPRISLLLLFNDNDNDFSANCTILLNRDAEYYLDPESLVMVKGYLGNNLIKQLF